VARDLGRSALKNVRLPIWALHAVPTLHGTELFGSGMQFSVGQPRVPRALLWRPGRAPAHWKAVERDIVTESFRPVGLGVEQTFRITHRVGAPGALVIDVPLEGMTASGGQNGVIDVRDAKGTVRAAYSQLRAVDAQTLLQEGEQPVVTQTVVDELDDLAARKGFSGAIPEGVGMVDESQSIGLRMQLLQTMREYGANEVGIYNDASIGATALGRGIPLISGDNALGSAVQELGGEWRPLP
jgi:hypothetical protein